ncbi:MAG: phosphoglycerate mutase family protein, partial [Alistipes sp.]|nr:phosphoglycerate mutase family protein [Alistipes sp.]
ECVEWHAWVADDQGREWQFDMIHILAGSRYDGFFERMAERIAAALTDRTRTAILRLKYLTPDDEHIMGVEYYQAVLRDGVRTWDEFVAWRTAHPVTGIVEWMP